MYTIKQIFTSVSYTNILNVQIDYLRLSTLKILFSEIVFYFKYLSKRSSNSIDSILRIPSQPLTF